MWNKRNAEYLKTRESGYLKLKLELHLNVF